jgi:hypothetical protein
MMLSCNCSSSPEICPYTCNTYSTAMGIVQFECIATARHVALRGQYELQCVRNEVFVFAVDGVESENGILANVGLSVCNAESPH